MTTAVIIVTSLCLAGMAWLVGSTIFNIVNKSREQRLKYYRNYKKGNFLLIYLIAMPMFFLAFYYENNQWALSLFEAIKSSVDLVVLKVSYGDTAALMQDNIYFGVAMWLCYVLVAVNLVFLAITIFIRRLENNYRLHALKSAKKVYVLVGYNEQNKNIISSIGNGAHCVLLVDDITDDVKNYAYIQQISYFKIVEGDISLTLKKLFDTAKSTSNVKEQQNLFESKSVEVIVNTLEDEKNLEYCQQISNLVAEQNLGELVWDDSRGLNAYVFAEPSNEQMFLKLTKRTSGCVHYINKYKLVAMDFVGKYPLTQFMSDEQIDYDNAVIKKDVCINVAMIGFGKTNQQIFLTSVANNQFLSFEDTPSGSKLKTKLVNYFIYDKKDSKNDKNLNHNYFRFDQEISSEEYLPLPEKVANESFFTLDINDKDFYVSLMKNLKSDAKHNKYNYLIIAFGTDMQNLDFAEKICEKLKEWEIDEYTHIFVKVRNDALKHSYVEAEHPKYVIFGNEKEVVYNVSQIVDEKTEAMAKDRHICYSMADKQKAFTDAKRIVEDAQKAGCSQEEISALKEKYKSQLVCDPQGWMKSAIKRWYDFHQTQRESNIYAVLSLRMKLQLMGFDYESGDEDGVEALYLDKYQNGDEIEYEDTGVVMGRKIEKYTLDFKHGTLRERMTIQEHQRWNAYMITCGFVPETLENIKKGKFKDFDTRKHSNLTTFDGLIEWRKIKAEVSGDSEEDCDVVKYDYQLMDNAAWLLNKHHYHIVKKQDK